MSWIYWFRNYYSCCNQWSLWCCDQLHNSLFWMSILLFLRKTLPIRGGILILNTLWERYSLMRSFKDISRYWITLIKRIFKIQKRFLNAMNFFSLKIEVFDLYVIRHYFDVQDGNLNRATSNARGTVSSPQHHASIFFSMHLCCIVSFTFS